MLRFVRPNASPAPRPAARPRAIEAARPPARPAQVVVVSAPHAGVGRTTLIANLAVGLLCAGRSVGVADLSGGDGRLGRWVMRRTRRIEAGENLPAPASPCGAERPHDDPLALWSRTLEAMAGVCDLLLVDAPTGTGSLSARLHEDADVVLTCIGESLCELDGLFEMDEAGDDVGRPGPYARLLWEARARRGRRGAAPFDWLLVRTRALLEPELAVMTTECAARFDRAERLLGARRGPRIAERAAWRVGLDEGLTVFDAPFAGRPWTHAPVQELRDLAIVAKLSHVAGASLGF